MRKVIKKKERFDNSSSIYTEPYHNGKVTYLKMVSGKVYWHIKYQEPYVFLFFDNEIPKFADVEGRFYEHLNDYYRLIAATPEQTALFWAKLKENGYTIRQNKIVKL